MFAVKGIAYDTVVRMMNDPVRARKAAELPIGMAPRALARMPDNGVSLGRKKKWQGVFCLLTDEERRIDRAAKAFVDLAKDARQRYGVVTGESPVGSRVLITS
jgi:hypothetical protein